MATAKTPNEQLILDFFDLLNAEKLQELKALLHPDATWTPMTKSDIPGAATHRGHEGIVDKFLVPVRGLFEGKDPQNEINTLVSTGDIVACETHGTGQLTNGKTYDNRYCWIVEIRDGKILAIREYMDTAYIQSLFS